MNRTEILRTRIIHGLNAVLRLSFKIFSAWDNCALLAVENLHLAMDSVSARGQCAHFWKTDCFECLSPHNSAA